MTTEAIWLHGVEDWITLFSVGDGNIRHHVQLNFIGYVAFPKSRQGGGEEGDGLRIRGRS